VDKATALLRERGLPTPPTLIIQADNTCRETRNQFLVLWASQLVSSSTFRAVQFSFFQTGHTHNQVDARFSQMVHHLQQAQVIETPKEMSSRI
jgi:hypothetical protein